MKTDYTIKYPDGTRTEIHLPTLADILTGALLIVAFAIFFGLVTMI